MSDQYTDRARRTMEFARQVASEFGHEYLGTEHILLGLIREGTGTATEVLNNLGIDPLKVREGTQRLLQKIEMTIMGRPPMTPRAKKVIQFANEEAIKLEDRLIGTGHLLLGLMREGDGIAGQVLANTNCTVLGGSEKQPLTVEILRDAIVRLGRMIDENETQKIVLPRTYELDPTKMSDGDWNGLARFLQRLTHMPNNECIVKVTVITGQGN